jgi:hypothetical protein
VQTGSVSKMPLLLRWIALCATLPVVARAQAPAASVSANLGLAPYNAAAPYDGGLAIVGRISGAVRLDERQIVELDVLSLGTLLTGDVYAPNARALPNTIGVAAGIAHVAGGRDRFSIGAGMGFYRVEDRAQAPGRSGIGFHAGGATVLMRSSHTALTLDARVILMPSMQGTRIWLMPLSAGVRFH